MKIVWACCALLTLGLGCKSGKLEPRTEVLLQIDAERLVKVTADHLKVEIASGPSGSPLTAGDPEEFDLSTDEFNWPASVALVAKPGHEDYVFEITINIEANGQRVARSRVKSSFIQHQTLLLKTLLYGECLRFLDCSGSETCVAPDGKPRCDDAQVDAASLPQYTPAGRGGQPAARGGEPAGGAGLAGGAAKGGAGGSTGVAGSAGARASGAGGQSGAPDAGTQDAAMPSGSCEKHGPEQCDNGVDDDCNGQLDCADSACTAGMQCVPASSLVGLMVPATSACPSGYDDGEQLVHRGLSDPGCGGCSCQPLPTTCSPQVYLYGTSTECTDDLAPSRNGTLVMSGIPQKPECGPGPIGASIGINTPMGWRVNMTQGADACRASGTAAPLPATWSSSMKLCVTTALRHGCDEGYACVPRVTGGHVCSQRETAACPGDTSLQTWQREYVDERRCGSCECAASGGSCRSLVVSLVRSSSSVGTAGTGGAAGGPSTTTTDCSIVDSSLHGGEKACLLTSYYPSAYMEGSPLDPTCSASAIVSGSLKPGAPLELCCTN